MFLTERIPSRLIRYGVELLVVFFGVWLGLLAEDYRESRQDIAAESVSLGRLARDLDFDRRDMTGNLQRAQIGHDAARWLLERSDAVDVSRDSMDYYLSGLQNHSILVANTSEYTALRSAGRINVIRDSDLRQRLTQLYERYPFITLLHDRENTSLRAAMAQIAPFVRSAPSNGRAFPAIRVIANPRDVLGDAGFLMHLSELVFLRSILSEEYDRMLREIEDLRTTALNDLGANRLDPGG